jgi:signal transduction histidine kinase
LTLAALLYLLWAAGHRAGVDGIVLTWQERVFLEPYLLVTLGAAACSVIGAIAILEWLDGLLLFSYSTTKETTITLACVACAALGTLSTVAIALPLRTVAVRRKAHILRQTTLTCRLFHWLRQVCGAALRALPFLWKVLLGFGLYFFGTLFLWSAHWTEGWAGPLWWMLNLTTLLGLCWWAVCFHRLRQGSQAIAAGNLEHQIDTHHMPQELRRLAEDLNNISIGLAGAVDEKMRSERFKAELITNVSHDLKTPLTSILNYVALLHTTEQTDPKAIAYIEVLERKSQRLKKLTEDLVEASKASTGTLRVDREKISMTQLIDQALGEWAERLEASRLTVVTTLPESETYVYADGRHLWRVMDNLLSNCVKYALEGTRVYLDLSRSKGMVTLSIKNISREPLNLPPERLLERFVRGEESRSTEGSGLGLSIAQNLTELQGGTFALSVDGDLFKATVTLPLAN